MIKTACNIALLPAADNLHQLNIHSVPPSAMLNRCTPHYIMILTLEQLTKDITNVDLEDILSCWQWRLTDMQAVITISSLGDLFLLGQDNAVYWLQTDGGDLAKVAEDLQQYKQYLTDEDKVDNWFLPLLVEQLLTAGKTLKKNQVYSFKKPTVLGGEYSVDNIQPTDMSVHFAFSGQISEQIKGLPDGTEVNINYKPQ